MSLDSVGGSNTNTGSRMKHSLSTPSGVDGTPSTPHHRGGKKLAVRVQMLDDTITMFQVQAKAMGKVLFEQVCRQLNLLEADYFGLEYQELGSNTKYWLDLEKPINRQVGLSLVDPLLRFCVKFYTPDPSQLEEEYTRYLFCLQVKRDLATGILQCNDNTAALMASYIVQASCGDYMVEDYPDHTYLSSYRFVPHQDGMMQRKIMENHKKHFGQSPAEADLNLLETARRCELYGMKMHAAKDIEGVPLNLAVAHMGIAVFQNIIRINTFSWAKIRKISFKRKKFLIKLHPEGYGYYKDTVEFFFEGRNECKNFWKKCVENHGFFRCSMVQNAPRRKARVLSRGSSFRYSGKTQKQIIEFVRDNYVKRQTFQRSQSFRQSSLQSGNRSQSHNSCNVNSSISTQPLLPTDTADWDYRNQSNNSTTRSQTRKGADALNHQRGTLTDPMRSQVTAAQVETYQTKTFAGESPSAPDPQDSSRSVSPRGDTWNSPIIRAADPARAHQDIHISENSPYHGLNGLSLDRRGEVLSATPNRYDLSLGSDKSSSLSRSERDAGTYDINQAEQRAKLEDHQNNNNNTFNRSTLDSTNGTMDMKRKRWPTDKEYYLAKELLMTERTYKKDLDIINTWLREELTNEHIESVQPLFQLFDSMVQHHSVFLRDLEHRIVLWEGRANGTTTNNNAVNGNGSINAENQKIGDVLLKNMVVLPIYEEYLETHRDILIQLNDMFKSDDHFQQIYREFEQQKICYVPIFYLLMKPFQRLSHYKLILEMLLEHYNDNHFDRTDCQGALVMLSRTLEQVESHTIDTNNFIILCELQRDLVGFDNLVENNRQLIRQGCLLKHSKRGLQQRMFFLFSDVLLYASKSPVNPTFKVLGHVPVRSLLTENAEHNAFVIFGGQKAITVSAGTTAEKTLWLAELSRATAEIKSRPHLQLSMGGLKNCSSSEEGLDLCGLTPAQLQQQQNLANKTPSTRSNTALHVCWHRGATIGLQDYIFATNNQLSGFLLRKFKNSSGWQKLWVVFTSFCLYFYKSYQDEFALASLPLLGYSVGPPSFQDSLQKEFVFKLSFKNHVYFFRAESEHTYHRWMEVLRSTTQTQDFKKISI